MPDSPHLDRPIPDLVRVSAVLPKESVDELREHAAAKGDNLTQGLKSAISTKLFLDRELEDKGTVLIKRKDGSMVQVILP
jgi:hypothetical protein